MYVEGDFELCTMRIFLKLDRQQTLTKDGCFRKKYVNIVLLLYKEYNTP